jgi:hypothetical protein
VKYRYNNKNLFLPALTQDSPFWEIEEFDKKSFFLKLCVNIQASIKQRPSTSFVKVNFNFPKSKLNSLLEQLKSTDNHTNYQQELQAYYGMGPNCPLIDIGWRSTELVYISNKQKKPKYRIGIVIHLTAPMPELEKLSDLVPLVDNVLDEKNCIQSLSNFLKKRDDLK